MKPQGDQEHVPLTLVPPSRPLRSTFDSPSSRLELDNNAQAPEHPQLALCSPGSSRHVIQPQPITKQSNPGDRPRTLPPPLILLQLGLAYVLHRSNLSGQVFELEPGQHAQARLPPRTRGLQYPVRELPPHSDF